jgi:hypothetical protein
MEAERMAVKKSASAEKALVKIGHAVTPAALSLLSLLAELDDASAGVMIEAGIRKIFDAKPAETRKALATLLRSKGYSIRDLRREPASVQNLDNGFDGAIAQGEQGGSSSPVAQAPAASFPRAPSNLMSRIGQISRSSGMPVDNAIERYDDESIPA